MADSPTGRFSSLLALAAVAASVAAVVQQLRRPRGERTWLGKVVGVPYDLRAPSLARLVSGLWEPDNPAIIVGKGYGVGWSVNLAALAARVRRALAGRAGASEA